MLHPKGDLEFAVQFPPQFDVAGPQLLPQEQWHTLVHILLHPELPQPLPHVVKQPLVQSVPHPPEHVALEQPLVLSLKHVE